MAASSTETVMNEETTMSPQSGKRLSFPARLLACARLPILRFLLRRRVRRLVLEHLEGVPLVVLPEVFNPAIFRTSALLARVVSDLPPVEDADALDLGTGSGAIAIFAARRGYRVVGVDINPEAARCARMNVLLNRLEERIQVREGDLFAPVAGERFDLVLFNPPFFRGEPKDRLDFAWRSTNVLERFAAGLPTALKPGGRALIVLSTDGDSASLLDALAVGGFAVHIRRQCDYGNEVITVYSVQHQEEAG
jgi:release factor glutamine methyltransferase